MRSVIGQGPDSGEDTTPAWLSRTRVEAFNAAGDQAAGKSREQVKGLYKAELRARGLDVPPGVLLDLEVSFITGDYPAGTSRAERALGGLVKRIYSLGREHPRDA